MAKLYSITKEMGKVQQAAASDLIFGKRAIAGVNVLLGEGEKALDDYRGGIYEAGGTAANMAKRS